MGRLAALLSFARTVRNGSNVSDVKVDPGGGPNITAQHFSAPGDDSFPLTTDYVALQEDSGTGREHAVGYVDPLNAPVAGEGEKRIYGRESSGAVTVQLHLKNTGEAELSNDNGVTILAPDGTLTHTVGLVVFTVNVDGTVSGSNGSGSFALQPTGDFVVNGVTIAANGDVNIPNSLVVNSVEVADHEHAQDNDSGGNTEQDTGPMK